MPGTSSIAALKSPQTSRTDDPALWVDALLPQDMAETKPRQNLGFLDEWR